MGHQRGDARAARARRREGPTAMYSKIFERRPVEAEGQRAVRVRSRTAPRRCRRPRGRPASRRARPAPVKVTSSRPCAALLTRGSSGPSPINTAFDVRRRLGRAAVASPRPAARRRASAGRRRRRRPARRAAGVNGSGPVAPGRKRVVSAPHSSSTILARRRVRREDRGAGRDDHARRARQMPLAPAPHRLDEQQPIEPRLASSPGSRSPAR